MKCEAENINSSITEERSTDYWRERAECLEEWVCELLRKNQTLRMGLPTEGHSQHQHREETPLTSSRLGLYEPLLFSGRPVFRSKSPKSGIEPGLSMCPQKECAEIREAVLQNCVMADPSLDLRTDENHFSG
jgi:hypothetical protein